MGRMCKKGIEAADQQCLKTGGSYLAVPRNTSPEPDSQGRDVAQGSVRLENGVIISAI